MLCACAEAGDRQAQGYVTLFEQWCAHELWHLPSPRAARSVTAARPLRGSGDRSGTRLSVQRQPASQVMESWPRSVSCSASLNDSPRETCMASSVPACPWIMALGHQPLAGKPLVGSSQVSLGSYCTRIMKLAKLRLELRCSKEQREDVTEPCWDRMVTLPQSWWPALDCWPLCAHWGIVSKMFWSLELLCLHFWSVWFLC